MGETDIVIKLLLTVEHEEDKGNLMFDLGRLMEKVGNHLPSALQASIEEKHGTVTILEGWRAEATIQAVSARMLKKRQQQRKEKERDHGEG